jgi:hypothetical protein
MMTPLRNFRRALCQMLVWAPVLLAPDLGHAQATWITRVPPERLLKWQPRTAEEAAHPEVLFDRRPPQSASRIAARPEVPAEMASGADYTWSELGPPARAGHLLVYDSRRHRMLMVGGMRAQDPAGSIWSHELPAGPWTQIATLSWTAPDFYSSPVAAALYDSLRDQLLVVPAGSSLAIQALSLGGTPSWSHVWSGPAAPDGFAGIALDTQRDAVAFLGVWDGAAAAHRLVRVPLGDPEAWTSVPTLGPQPTIPDRGAAVYDAALDAYDVLVNTGYLGGSDAHLFALSAGSAPTWSPLALPNFPATPFPDGAATQLSLDAAQGRLIVTNEAGDMLAMSTSGLPLQWLTAPGTDAWRYAGASAFDPVARRLYLNGGSTTSYLFMARSPSRLFVSATVDSGTDYASGSPAAGTVAAWLREGAAPPPSPLQLGADSDSLPRPRFAQFSIVDPVHNLLIWYGGQATDGTGDLLGDLWTLSLDPGGRWQRVPDLAPGPGNRRMGSIVYDAARSRFVLLGGDDLHQHLLDAWELRLSPSPAWRSLAQDGPVPSYQAIYPDDALGCMWSVSYGLSPIRRLTLDVDAVHYEEVIASGPDLPPTYYYRLDLAGFDPVHHRLMWFRDRSGYSADLDQFVTTDVGGLSAAWQTRSILGVLPTWRAFFSSTFDAAASRLVIHGGEMDNGVYFADTWALQLPIDQPTAALVSLADASCDAAGVHLRWDVSAPTGTNCTVERSTDAVSWTLAGVASWTGSHEVRFTGAPPAGGVREAFRLRLAVAGGDQVGEIVWLSAPAAYAAIAIATVSNPCRGAPSLRLSLGASGPARLRLLDVSGRVVSEANLPVGTQRWTSGHAPSPGLYFAELVQAGQRRVARVVVTP